jgi:protein TonB
VLDCLIGADLAIRCRATSESPAGYGFAAAALRVAQRYRSQPTMEDGRPAAGERTTIAISFKPG